MQTHSICTLTVHNRYLQDDTACSASAIPYPSLLGAQFLNLTATPVLNHAAISLQGDSHFAKNLTGLNFCNVSISYTHPGQNDLINVQVWLPTSWNGRFMGTGGGGFATGLFDPSLSNAISMGYSAASTDGGHPGVSTDWALISPGNVNLFELQDFASVSLNDMTVIGKAVSTSYYQKAPAYSYWSGCSTGGRQGMMLAQRYPDAYNGILAAAPAFNWASFLVAEYWPQVFMNTKNSYPRNCELAAITAAATKACDELDGVADGIVSRPDLCHFNPHTLVGQAFSCNGLASTFTQTGAIVAEATWKGARSANGSFLWYGLLYDAPLTALAGTTCGPAGNCTGTPFSIASDWIRLFIKKNAAFNLTSLTRKQYDSVFHASKQQFTSFIDTADPDLSEFRDSGGKMISWHGLSDQLIFPAGTTNYYDHVKALDKTVTNYYRHFEAPGVQHCSGGIGPFPGSALDDLVAWVEKGVAPSVLLGTSLPVNGTVLKRDLCQYPLVSFYKGGDPTVASSFECVKAKKH